MSKIVLASNNSHKIKEFSKILDEENIQLISQSKLDIPEADETGLTFLENSIIDFSEELIGAKFTIDNPNAKTSCGCGTSFSI